jgi:hypothetical protein
MAGIFQGDIIIKAAIELGFEDMRKNSWLIDHMLEDLTRNRYLKDKYGKKQVEACKEWLANNQVDIYLRPRDDKDRMPNITIELGASTEKSEMKHLGDLSAHKTILLPNQIGQPIPYVIPPFVPTDYDEATGVVSVDPSIDLRAIAPDMILVNPANGDGYKILSIGPNTLMIAPNQFIAASQLGIVPQYQYYEARIQHAFFDETYVISCNAHGDIQTVLWMWSIVKYAILRYKQSLLEANGFAETVVSSGNPDINYTMSTEGGEKIYTRSITIHGQVENTWIAAPHRYVESIVLGDKTSAGYSGGINILSNLDAPPFIDKDDQNWVTVEDSDDENE